MRIVVVMDSFKGSLTAVRACEMVTEAIALVMHDSEIIIKPMADGGGGAVKEKSNSLWRVYGGTPGLGP